MENEQTLVAGAKKAGFAAAVSAITLPVVVQAQTDYSAITDAVDWSSVTTGIIAVLALGAAVVVAFVGGKMLISAIRGAK